MARLETKGSPQLELVRSFLLGFEKQDVGLFEKPIHKNFRRTFHPRSIGKPEQTREQYLQYAEEFASLWGEEREVSYIYCCLILHVPG